MIKDRIGLLNDLLENDEGISRDDMFDSIIPKSHNEIYAVYNILKDSDSLNGCTTCKPILQGDQFSIKIHLPDDDKTKCIEYLESNEFKVDCFRDYSFEVELETHDEYIILLIK